MKKYIIIIMIVMITIPLAVVYAGQLSSDAASSSNDEQSAEVSCGNPPVVECVGYDQWRKFDSDFREEEDSSPDPKNDNTITFSNIAYKEHNEPIAFDWNATVGVGKVVVKADTSDYGTTYSPPALSGSESTSNRCCEPSGI